MIEFVVKEPFYIKGLSPRWYRVDTAAKTVTLLGHGGVTVPIRGGIFVDLMVPEERSEFLHKCADFWDEFGWVEANASTQPRKGREFIIL